MASTEKKTIWLISELYYPEETGTGYYLTNIAEGLSEHYEVRVICNQPTYASRGLRAPSSELRNGVTIKRCSALALNKNIFLLRLVNLFSISLSIFTQTLHQIRKNDIVFVVTNPPLLPFLVQVACRIKKSKSVLLVHDVYPDTMIAAGMLKKYSLISRFLNYMNRLLYRSVDRIGVLGRDMEALVKKKLGKDRFDHIFVARCWADVEEVFPSSRTGSSFLKQLGLSDKFVVQYAGNIGRVQGIETLFETAKRLSLINQRIHFLIIGSGAKRNWLESSIEVNNLQNCTLHEALPRSEQQIFLNACDVAVISLVPDMVGVGVPSRMYNILASGKPIIAAVDQESELAQVIKEEKIGWVVPTNQPDKLSDAILEANLSRALLTEIGKRARFAAENRFAFKRIIQSYEKIIESFE